MIDCPPSHFQYFSCNIDPCSPQAELTINYEDDSKFSQSAKSSIQWSNTDEGKAHIDFSPQVTKKIVHRGKQRSKKIAKDFTMQEDQKILNLVLKLGPKFKKVAKALNAKSVNIIKNHYYRNLRYRWHEVLGMEYIHLNERKEAITLNSLLSNVPIHSDLKNILNSCFTGMQELLGQCMMITAP